MHADFQVCNGIVVQFYICSIGKTIQSSHQYIGVVSKHNNLRMDHLALDQAPRLSPMHTSCYGDEDLVTLMH